MCVAMGDVCMCVGGWLTCVSIREGIGLAKGIPRARDRQGTELPLELDVQKRNLIMMMMMMMIIMMEESVSLSV